MVEYERTIFETLDPPLPPKYPEPAMPMVVLAFVAPVEGLTLETTGTAVVTTSFTELVLLLPAPVVTLTS